MQLPGYGFEGLKTAASSDPFMKISLPSEIL
jgi:hypothetical protein